jgi:hypothetical protein
MPDLGLNAPHSWLWTGAWGLGWCALMLAFSPIADRAASLLVKTPPNLTAFRALQQSVWKLILGIAIAWALGGFIEEIVFRGVVLNVVRDALAARLPLSIATAFAVLIAAVGAAAFHFYQGLRAVLIVGQLSVLFGLLYVASGGNLWAVILCHGLYDTVAFIRFATKTSKYSDLG